MHDQFFLKIIIGLFSLLLISIVFALIFNTKFRQDLIGAPGKANVFGILTVEGVVIVILCAIFTSALVYMADKFKDAIAPTADNNIIHKNDLPVSIRFLDRHSMVKKIERLIDNKNNPPDSVLVDRLLELDYTSPVSKTIRAMRTKKQGPWKQDAEKLTIGIPKIENQPEVGYSYVCASSRYTNLDVSLTNGLEDNLGANIDLKVKNGGIDEVDCASKKVIPSFLINCLDAKKVFSSELIECTETGNPKYQQKYYDILKNVIIEDNKHKIYLPVWIIIKDIS